MNRKISLGLAIALIFVSITATFAITMTVSQRIYNGLISRLSSSFELYDGIYAIDNYVQTNFYTDVNNSSILADTAEGYMRGLKDNGSFFMQPREYLEYTRKMAGEGGVGVVARYSPETGKITVIEVNSDSSAENSELKVGDEIIALEDEKVTSSNYESILDALQVGRRFESVSLTYSRNGIQKTVTVMRGYTRSVTSSYLGEIGCVRFSGFFANTADQFREEIDKLNQAGATALIIDLRNCSDGTIEYASQVADILLPSGANTSNAITQSFKRDNSVYKTYTSDTASITYPGGIVVLTNNSTSGGAELLAAQLRDFSKCTIVGTATAGQMTEQAVYTLDDGSAISLTVAKVSSYSGKTYCDGKGIEPDDVREQPAGAIIADSFEQIAGDPVLQYAYAMLTN